jgi:hypothetical protein
MFGGIMDPAKIEAVLQPLQTMDDAGKFFALTQAAQTLSLPRCISELLKFMVVHSQPGVMLRIPVEKEKEIKAEMDRLQQANDIEGMEALLEKNKQYAVDKETSLLGEGKATVTVAEIEQFGSHIRDLMIKERVDIDTAIYTLLSFASHIAMARDPIFSMAIDSLMRFMKAPIGRDVHVMPTNAQAPADLN